MASRNVRYALRLCIMNYLLCWAERGVKLLMPRAVAWCVSSFFSGIASAEVAVSSICHFGGAASCSSVFACEKDERCLDVIRARCSPSLMMTDVLELLPADLRAAALRVSGDATAIRRVLLGGTATVCHIALGVASPGALSGVLLRGRLVQTSRQSGGGLACRGLAWCCSMRGSS